MVDKSTLDDCLQGISFPADSNAIADCASANSCSHDIISQLRSMPSRTFSSEDELLCRLGNTDACGGDAGASTGGNMVDALNTHQRADYAQIMR